MATFWSAETEVVDSAVATMAARNVGKTALKRMFNMTFSSCQADTLARIRAQCSPCITWRFHAARDCVFDIPSRVDRAENSTHKASLNRLDRFLVSLHGGVK
jgi:hypothetical protein